MKYFIFLLLLVSGNVMAQSVGHFRYDTVLIEKIGGNGELVVRNSTRDSLGIMVNMGNGRTEFRKVRRINDSTFIFGRDTVEIKGGAAGGTGTVTSVAALTLGTTGTDLTSSVANSTTTPVITLNVPTASASNRGALSSTDWSTFNSKQATISVTSPITLTGASVGMVNQGTTTTVLHGNASGNPTFGAVSLTADVSGTLSIANGGTGQTTANTAFNALAPSQTSNSGKYLTTDGTNTSWGTVSSGAGWLTTGNAATAATDFLGTTNNVSLRFRTNNTRVAVLDSTGKFGINVNVPTAALHVNGLGNDSTTFALKINNSDGVNNALVVRNNPLPFVGIGTDSLTEYATDVNDANPVTYNYFTNFNRDINARAIWKLGNKSTGAGAYASLEIGDARKSNNIWVQSIYSTNTSAGILAGTGLIHTGSGLTNGMQLYADNGYLALGVSPTVSTGLTEIVITPYPTQKIGFHTRTPDKDVSLIRTSTGQVGMDILNAGTGTASSVSFAVGEGSTITGNKYAALQYFNNSYTTSGLYTANSTSLYSTSTAGLSLAAVNATGYMPFYTGGDVAANERMRILANGTIGIGTTSTDKDITLAKTTNGQVSMDILNASTGTSANAALILGEGATVTSNKYFALYYNNNSNNGTAPYAANSTVMAHNGTAAMSLVSANATGYLNFYTGGDAAGNERARILANGNFGVNTTAATSTLTVNGSFATAYVAKTANYTLTSSDYTVNVTANSNTYTLPTAVSITGRTYTIKNSGAGTPTVATTSSQTIDGSTTYSLSAQYKYVTVQSDGANWIVIANN